ncbi:MAG: zinc-dependent metalloprotease [Actinomycetota bacterium]|nr:zinc-dependent metalloprotease [Actinomycetota bacterium]
MSASLPDPAEQGRHFGDADDAREAGSGAGAGPGLVDWRVAERVALWVINRRAPGVTFDADELTRSFGEATARAEELVAASTGWRAPTPARSVVTDRAGWARANVASFQRLLTPALVKFERRKEEKREERRRSGTRPSWLVDLPEPIASKVAGAGRSASGAQLGAVLAWMSTRVLGQYDLLLTEDAAEDQDLLYYVGPNVVELERRHGFDPGEFRLWLALHEVTHRCQFTAVPWLRGYFLSLVDKAIEPFQADPGRLAEMVRRAGEQLRSHQSPLDDAGVLGIVASDQQLEAIRSLQAMMSLLEGHGDVTMDRAGAADVPGAARFSQVLRERRESLKGPAKVLQQVLGLEAKLRQYQQGEEFIHAVEARGGRELIDRVWRGPEWLPNLQEIREPQRWIARVEAVRDDA